MNNFYVKSKSDLETEVADDYTIYKRHVDEEESSDDEDGIELKQVEDKYRSSSAVVQTSEDSEEGERTHEHVPIQSTSIHIPEVEVIPKLSECFIRFNGLQGSKKLEDFLFKLEWCKKMYEIPDQDAIDDLGEVFYGFARVWWNSIRKKPTKWREVRMLIKKTFGWNPVYQNRLTKYMTERRSHKKYS